MEEAEKLARNLVATGKLIRDRIIRAQAHHFRNSGARNRFGDLSLPQLEAARAIRLRSKVSMNELSVLLNVSPPSASAMVDRLVDKGVLNRLPSADDRRKVEISVSPEAIEYMDGIEEAIIQSFVELIEKIGPDTGRRWCDALDQARRILEEERVFV